jgi:hypothetical protein
MAPFGGGLLQLVAYGAQDGYFTQYEREPEFDHICNVKIVTNRHYHNIEIVEIFWINITDDMKIEQYEYDKLFKDFNKAKLIKLDDEFNVKINLENSENINKLKLYSSKVVKLETDVTNNKRNGDKKMKNKNKNKNVEKN